jgi:hypothetical protein
MHLHVPACQRFPIGLAIQLHHRYPATSSSYTSMYLHVPACWRSPVKTKKLAASVPSASSTLLRHAGMLANSVVSFLLFGYPSDMTSVSSPLTCAHHLFPRRPLGCFLLSFHFLLIPLPPNYNAHFYSSSSTPIIPFLFLAPGTFFVLSALSRSIEQAMGRNYLFLGRTFAQWCSARAPS